jgi:hypothetical protein
MMLEVLMKIACPGAVGCSKVIPRCCYGQDDLSIPEFLDRRKDQPFLHVKNNISRSPKTPGCQYRNALQHCLTRAARAAHLSKMPAERVAATLNAVPAIGDWCRELHRGVAQRDLYCHGVKTTIFARYLVETALILGLVKQAFAAEHYREKGGEHVFKARGGGLEIHPFVSRADHVAPSHLMATRPK